MCALSAADFRFERIEKKFWMTTEQYCALLPVFDVHMQHDRFGISTICNIYYDTPDYTLIRRSIERPLFKEKLRIRSYGIPGNDDIVFAEIKRKLNGIGYKRRISVPFGEAKKLLRAEPIRCNDPQTEAELLAFVERYHPEPKVYLTYQRYAMTAKDDPGFRVTIDRDLQYRISEVEYPSKDGMKPILEDESLVLMEIKALGAIPQWLTDEMSRLQIRQAPFSKVGACYTRHIAPICVYGKNIAKGK